MAGFKVATACILLIIVVGEGREASSQDFVPLPVSYAKDRIDKMIAEISAIPRPYSVKGGASYMVRPSGADDEDVVLMEYIFSTLVLSPTRTRFALKSTTSGSHTYDEYYQFLRNGKSRRIAKSFNEVRMDVQTLQEKDALPTMKFFGLDPRIFPLCELAALRLPYPLDYLGLMSRFKPVGARRGNGSFEGLYLSENKNAVWLIQFENTPDWAPRRVSTYRSSGEPWSDDRDAFEQLSEWRLTSTTASTWAKHEEIGYVPATVRLYARPSLPTGELSEGEIVLADWQFNDEIDESELDEKRFTSERLEKFSFEAIKSIIVESRRSSVEKMTRN